MAGVQPQEENRVRHFLSRFGQVEIDGRIAEIAVEIRRKQGIRLPDAIIWASTIQREALLVTRNRKDFPPAEPGIRIPYEI